MTVSMSPRSSMNVEEIKSMNFLGLQINNIFNQSSDKTFQITGLAQELLGAKKETPQQTQAALIASKYGSFIDEKLLKLFAMSLNKLPEDPMEISFKYLQKAPGYDPIKGFQVPNNWEKNETVTLNQIYKEQFFGWILKNHQLSFSSILYMSHILKNFDNPSVQLDSQIWSFFSLTGRKQKQLEEFRSKYEFLLENKFFYSFPIQLEKIIITRDLHKSIYHQYGLFERFFIWLLEELSKRAQEPNGAQMIKNALENFSWKDLSVKVLAHRLKKMLPFLQAKFISLIELSNKQILILEKDKERFKSLQEKQVETNKVLKICKDKKEQISRQDAQVKNKKKRRQHKTKFNIKATVNALLEGYQELAEQGFSEPEMATRFNQNLHTILKEQMTTLGHVQQAEAYFTQQKNLIEQDIGKLQQKLSDDMFYLLKEDLTCILFLLNHIDVEVAKEQTRWKGGRLTLSINQFDERLERELIAEFEVSSSKASKPLDFSDEEKAIEEEPLPSEEEFLESEPARPPATAPEPYTSEQIQSYLSNQAENKQLNGALSQSVGSLLQQIEPHLHQKQGREVYDHALLGAAALEQMAQAVCDGRIGHAGLGFRSGLIHCHFAVEQILSQEIFQRTGKIANSHNLTALANELEVNPQKLFSKKEQEFLEEVRVHLWFHYPEDYTGYFVHNHSTPKAFSLLKTLSHSEITKEQVQESMKFAFEKYCQTLELITKLSKAPAQGAIELFKSNLSDLQKHIDAIAATPRKLPIIRSRLIEKMDQISGMLISLDQLIHIKDLEDGWLLAVFDSIKSYLQLMKNSLEIPQTAIKHSLQKFIQVETLLNMDRLFKNLFRIVSFLYLGEDSHMHNLNSFYSIIQNFYQEPLSKEDRSLLKSINLSTTHHYLHKKSHADLKKAYSRFLDNARALLSVSEEFSVATKGGDISLESLQKAMEENSPIMQTMDQSLDLFRRLLGPVIAQMQKIDNDIKEDLNRLQVG